MKSDNHYMQLAIKEAEKAKAVNEYRVGAVIVKEGQILSSAYSLESLEMKHAEELAISKCGKYSLVNAILYCTMEPCNFRESGKTPCSDLIINLKIKRVVFGVYDLDKPINNITGYENLRRSNIEVFHLECMEEEIKKITPELFGVSLWR